MCGQSNGHCSEGKEYSLESKRVWRLRIEKPAGFSKNLFVSKTGRFSVKPAGFPLRNRPVGQVT
jgi:hypothetical protein